MAYMITYDKKGCIGAGECEALFPQMWRLQNDGRADLSGARFDEASKRFVLKIEDAEFAIQKKVIGSCPAGCISINKI